MVIMVIGIHTIGITDTDMITVVATTVTVITTMIGGIQEIGIITDNRGVSPSGLTPNQGV